MEENIILSHSYLSQFNTTDNSSFKIVPFHLTKEIAAPISTKKLKRYQFKTEFDRMYKNAKLDNDLLSIWVGYHGMQLFYNKTQVQDNLSTYPPYLETANEEIQNIARTIFYELKKHPDKYDLSSIVMALAQNGGVCNIQKEVGLRMVYASMTDSILQHVSSRSIETKVLILLRNLRETLTETVAKAYIMKTYSEMNTHYIIPIRNKLSPHIGLNVIPDSSNCPAGEADYLGDFLKLYTVDEIIKCLRIALNDSPRKLDYLDVLAFLEKHKPEDVDEYEFKQEFLFDISTGYFSDAGILFMLTKMKIIQLISDPDIEWDQAKSQADMDDDSIVETSSETDTPTDEESVSIEKDISILDNLEITIKKPRNNKKEVKVKVKPVIKKRNNCTLL